jgi:disulfide bond formation protein DsbB
MTTLTSRQIILAATLFSVLSSLGAWGFQALGYQPCQLCYLQRYPHYTAVVIGALALATGWHRLAWAGALAALTTSAIGFYHTGVERKWWPGPASCSGGGGDISGVTPEELLQQLTATDFVPCDEIPWRLSDAIPLPVLDITMANLNAVGSLAAALVWIAAARRA